MRETFLRLAGRAAPLAFLAGTRVLPVVVDRVRWALVRWLLAEGPYYAGALARKVGRDPSVVSKHLSTLRKAGVIESVPSTVGDNRHDTYAVAAKWRVADEPLTLEFGSARVRFDLPHS